MIPLVSEQILLSYIPKTEHEYIDREYSLKFPFNLEVFQIDISKNYPELKEENKFDLIELIRQEVITHNLVVLHTVSPQLKNKLPQILDDMNLSVDPKYFIGTKHDDEKREITSAIAGMLIFFPQSKESLLLEEQLIRKGETSHSVVGTYYWENKVIGYNLNAF